MNLLLFDYGEVQLLDKLGLTLGSLEGLLVKSIQSLGLPFEDFEEVPLDSLDPGLAQQFLEFLLCCMADY